MSSLTTRDNKESIFFVDNEEGSRYSRITRKGIYKKNNETLSTHPRTNKKKDTPNVLERYSKIKKKTLKVVLIYSIKPFFLLWIQLDRDRFIFNIFFGLPTQMPNVLAVAPTRVSFTAISIFIFFQVPCVKKKTNQSKIRQRNRLCRVRFFYGINNSCLWPLEMTSARTNEK